MKNCLENTAILSIPALVLCIMLGMLFMSSSVPKGPVYEILSRQVKAKCVLTENQEAQGTHTAYVYPYSNVSDVWAWYQRTRKECGVV